jgi:hypothetical protein
LCKPNICLYRTQKLFPRRFILDRFNCTSHRRIYGVLVPCFYIYKTKCNGHWYTQKSRFHDIFSIKNRSKYSFLNVHTNVDIKFTAHNAFLEKQLPGSNLLRTTPFRNNSYQVQIYCAQRLSGITVTRFKFTAHDAFQE